MLDELKRTSSRPRRAWSATLLLLGLFALVLGVFGAVYFERNRPASSPEIATTVLPTEGPVAPAPIAQPPEVAQQPVTPKQNQRISSPESVPSQTGSSSLSALSTPQIQPVRPSSPETGAQKLAKITPTAAPANIAAAGPRYWVEFGTYTGSFYADRLKNQLGTLGIPAVIASTPSRDGRQYLEVRSDGDSDRQEALAYAAKAQTAFKISPLLHRVAAASTPTAMHTTAAPSSGAHWVQFGAFHIKAGAEDILSQLLKSGIQSSVIEEKSSQGDTLYVVRSAGLSNHAEASKIAQEGGAALHSNDFLIGQSRHIQGLQEGLHGGASPR